MKRLAPLLALFAVLALALPALAAKPKNGKFAGEGTYTAGDGKKYEAVVRLKVKKGRIVRFYARSKPVPTGNTLKFPKGVKVKKNGKFFVKTSGFQSWTIRGRFTKPGKATGTFEAKSPDAVGSFPKTKFTVKRKG